MTINCFGNVSDELAKAVKKHAGDIAGPGATLYEGHAQADADEVESTLASGRTLAVAHAPAGPVFGGRIPALTHLTEPAALVAVSRQCAGHGHATSITLVPESRPAPRAVLTDEQGQQTKLGPGTVTSPTAADIAAALAGHTQASAAAVGDSSLIPPSGANFGIVQWNMPWTGTAKQDFWDENHGHSQMLGSNTSQTYYVYYANGNGSATPYYVVLAVSSGTVQPAVGGPLCDYGPNERIFVLNTNLISVDLAKAPAASSLITYSPDGTRSTPVYDSVEIPMTVMALSGGGLQSTPFTAARSNSVPNEDWGVRKTSIAGRGPYLAAVEYYNITGWDASSEESFSVWWQQMYDQNDNVIELDAQCRTSASFDTMAAWQVPQNAGNQAPLSFQVRYTQNVSMTGFANLSGTGNGHHQQYTSNWWWDWSLPVWDLVALTGAQ